jgi:hypothetical protein
VIRVWSLSNKPLHLTIPPQGNRSIIERPGACGGLAGERQTVRPTGTTMYSVAVVLFGIALTAPVLALPAALGLVHNGVLGVALAWPFWLALLGAPGFVRGLLICRPGRGVLARRPWLTASSVIVILVASIGGVWMSRWMFLFLPGSLAGVGSSVLLLVSLLRRGRVGARDAA